MATVTGVTAERANEIEAASVVGASIQGNDLVLVTRGSGDGGTQINVGRIIPPIVNNYPVGSIYFTDRSANPSTYMGGGTWVRWGKGRVPVGIDEADGQFNDLEETGGAKTHVLSGAEMPNHNHGGHTSYESHDHSHGGYTSVNGNHTHGYIAQDPAPQTAGGANNYYTGRIGTQTDAAGDHSHSIQTYGVNTNHYHGITAEGGNAAHNNLQPYITCYIWKRTA